MSEENDDNWAMPKPVFRSSAGSLPKSFQETMSQSFSPDSETGKIDDNEDILGLMEFPAAVPPETALEKPIEIVDLASQPIAENVVRAKPEPPPRQQTSIAFIVLLVAGLVAAIVAVYYLLT